MESKTYINNPITAVPFLLVSISSPESIQDFENWAADVVQRSKTPGHFLNIAIDCEGDNLGTAENSLTLVQIGEIFKDTFNIHQQGLTIESVPDIGNLPGFAVEFPAPENVIEILSSILNQKNIIKYTFDFVGDFCCLLEAGVRINPENIFDAQVNFKQPPTFRGRNFYISTINGKSLMETVSIAKELDPLGNSAQQHLINSKSFDFCLFDFQNRSKSLLQRKAIQQTPEFLEMAIMDVFLTGLAVKQRISEGNVTLVFKASATKWSQMIDLNRHWKSEIGASLIRQRNFASKMLSRFSVDKVGKMDLTKKPEVLKLLKFWTRAKFIVSLPSRIGAASVDPDCLRFAQALESVIGQKLELVDFSILDE